MNRQTRLDLLLWLAYIGCLGILFYPGIIGGQIPAFRDAYHFYYPQAVWLDSCAARGDWFPTWNPNECLGVSVAGQPSAALYYPLRTLWWLPWLSLAQRYSIYMLVHVVIAGLGMRYSARALGLSAAPSWLAAISYSLSCPVLFQHCNVIFLASAAWAGFALGAAILGVRSQSNRCRLSCLVFSAACSLMFLAGDPQTAVHAFVLAALAIGTQVLWQIDAARRAISGASLRFLQPFIRGSLWWCSACLIFTLVTAVQWIPALRWASHSGRFANERMRAVSQSPELSEVLDVATEVPHTVYSFSLSPWHLATVVWPTLGGYYLPENSRLFDAIASEGRMWIPSLYFGAIPCFLLIGGLRRGLASKQRRTLTSMPVVLGLSGLFVLAMLLAFGNYSVLWLVRSGMQGCGWGELVRQWPGDEVGSPYWLLTKVVPGYAGFRYPAKWTVWMVVAASLLAAFCMSQRSEQVAEAKVLPIRWLLRLSLLGLGLSILLGAASQVGFSDEVDRWLANHASDRLLGAPTAWAIAKNCCIAFAVPAVALLVNGRARASTTILLFTMAEMTFVGSQWIVFTETPPTAYVPLPAAETSFVWGNTRVDDTGLGQLTLGKLGTLRFGRTLQATQSILPVEMQRLVQWLIRQDTRQIHQPKLDAVLASLGVEQRIVSTVSGDASLQKITSPAPFCELIVAANANESVTASSHATEDTYGRVLGWEWLQSSELRIVVQSSVPCRLVVRQYNDGGWIGTLAGESIDLQPEADELFVEWALPAGENEIVLHRKWLW